MVAYTPITDEYLDLLIKRLNNREAVATNELLLDVCRELKDTRKGPEIYPKKSKYASRKVGPAVAQEICDRFQSGQTKSQIARYFHISPTTVANVVRGNIGSSAKAVMLYLEGSGRSFRCDECGGNYFHLTSPQDKRPLCTCSQCGAMYEYELCAERVDVTYVVRKPEAPNES